MTDIIHAQIVSIDLEGGRITLDDESAWRVAPDHRPLILRWADGLALRLEPNDPDKIYPYRLVEPESGTTVSVVGSQGRSSWPWMDR
ncbi:MAG TPA: hypothetical protein VJT70_01535 [Sphingomicrobium sp.]|nr:hypothetical protein [Sphingomicrobium sp.]